MRESGIISTFGETYLVNRFAVQCIEINVMDFICQFVRLNMQKVIQCS